jgi:hypothetical protein
MDDQLQEYENQLADIEELLQATPDDESLLALKNDIIELITLTKAGPSSEDHGDTEYPTRLTSYPAGSASQQDDDEVEAHKNANTSITAISIEVTQLPEKKKKLQNIKDFEIPAHLLPNENDSEAEKNKKWRAIKALKSKWREKRKEFDSSKKQQTWQNFQQKKKQKDKSIFATQDGENAKTGVISGGIMTEFGARKRHKHST